MIKMSVLNVYYRRKKPACRFSCELFKFMHSIIFKTYTNVGIFEITRLIIFL